MFTRFRIDLTSFLVGAAAASLFWLLISRLKPLIPLGLGLLRKRYQSIRQHNLEGADEFIRRDILRRAQKMHLAANLFALDEILIRPTLVAPPPSIEPDLPPPHETIAAQTIPYTPDWPEVTANLGPTEIAIGTALLHGSSIAILGQPGAGKTVALAYLACLLARKDPTLGALKDFLPIHLHVLDLALSEQAIHAPLGPILKALTPRTGVIYQAQLSRLIASALHEGTAIFLLDGLDELDPSALELAVVFIKAFREKYPQTRLITAISPYQFGGLANCDIVPLGLSAWGSNRRSQFLDRWRELWTLHVSPEISKQSNLVLVSPHLIDNWLRAERGCPTPLEWTARVWGAYSGDLRVGISSALETLTTRVSFALPNPETLSILAKEFITRKKSALSYADLVKLLNNLPGNPISPSVSKDLLEADLAEIIKKKTGKGKRDIILSPVEQALELLVKQGLMVEHQDATMRFVSPVIGGYLAAKRATAEDITLMLENPLYSLNHQALRFVSAVGQEVDWVESMIQREPALFQERLLAAARWLGDSSGNLPWRAFIFRALIAGIQDENLPMALRCRMVAAFACSNDPSAPKLFKQLITSRMPNVRLLATLAIGVWGEGSLNADLTAMLQDSEQTIRNAACLALVSLHTEASLGAVAESLMNGDEMLRQAAAEGLVFLPHQGDEIIREAAKLTDILSRRAAVFGLMQLREPWAKELLDKLAVEDGQWVVRNAAVQALELLQEVDPRVPKPMPPAHESAWLIAFAAKRGTGLSAVQSPTEVLLMALKSGTVEDQLAALPYLKKSPDENVIRAVFGAYFGDQPELKDAAHNVIWQWNLDGVKLPAPSAYGLNY